MFIRLLISSIFFIVLVHSEVTNSSKGQISAVTTNPILPKSGSQYDDYDFNDKKSNGEGSGSSANLDDYADEEDDQLSKITASTTVSTSTTTITRTTTTKKITSSTKKTDLDIDEFSEDYKDDVADDVDYNEVSTKITTTSTPVLSTTRSSSSTGQRRSPIRVFFSFLTRPPIAAGILAGLAIGILTSVILLICLVQRFNKRQRTHSSYTTGLLYPNQYGYSKSPQEFYA